MEEVRQVAGHGHFCPLEETGQKGSPSLYKLARGARELAGERSSQKNTVVGGQRQNHRTWCRVGGRPQSTGKKVAKFLASSILEKGKVLCLGEGKSYQFCEKGD